MAYINPSPFHTSMGDLLAHFRVHCIDARPALLERDALWGSENQALRSELNQLRADLATRDENQRWLNLGFHASEEKAEKERRKSKELEEKIVVMEREVAEVRAEKIAVEEGLKEKICVLVDRVLDLERDKGAGIERVEASERLWSAKMEAMGKADAELILKGNVALEELRGRIGVLEKEMAEKDIEIGRVLEEKMDVETRNKILEEESNEKISELEKMAGVLERQKAEKDIEIGRVLKEKMAVETRNKILEEESNEKISELEKRAVVLEREKAEKENEIGRVLKEKMALETRNKILEKENSEKTSEMEARVHREKKDENNESDRIVEINKAVETLMVLERVLKEKMDLETRNKIMEDERNKKISELEKRAVLLEREKATRDLKIGRVLKEKMALETQNRILENSKKTSEMEARVHREKKDKNNESDRIVELSKGLETQKKLEEEAEKQVFGLLETIMALEREKEALAAEVSRMKVLEEERAELVRVVEELRAEKVDVEALHSMIIEMEREVAELRAEKIAVEEGLKEEICMLLNRIRVLESHMGREEGVNEEKIEELCGRIQVLEKKKGRLEEEVEKRKKKIPQLVKTIETLKDEKRVDADLILTLRSSFEKEKAEKDAEIGRVLEEKMALEELKSSLEEEVEKTKKKMSQVVKKMSQLVKKIPQLLKTIEMLKDEKRVDAELSLKLRSSFEKEKVEKDTEIGKVLEEKMALEELKRCLEGELKKLNRDREKESLGVSELLGRIGVLEKEKAEKDTEVGRVLKEKMALETRNKILEEESNEKISELEKKVVVLEREKAEMEAQAHKEKKDVSNELNKALETQKRLGEEAEKRVSGFVETIMVLEREKEALAAKVSKLYEEKRKGTHNIELLERIHMILNGNEAEKDDYEKKNSELADRISVLEREKRGLEASIREKDEVIKVLDQENSWLEDLKKELEIVIKVLASKLKEDAHLTDNVGTLDTPWQNEGQNSAGVANSSEHHGSVNDNVENSDGKSEAGMTRTNARKRKRSIIKCEELGIKIPKPACEHLLASTGVVDDEPVLVACEKNTEMNNGSLPTNGSNGSDVMVACRWEADQDLLDAFEVDPELCLKAVCALYRQHKRLSDSGNTSLSPGSRVFKPEYMCRAITFGQFLTTEDPECRRMKKLVRKLNRLDPLAVGVCRSIAKQHCQQVFEIYNNKEDPLFLS